MALSFVDQGDSPGSSSNYNAVTPGDIALVFAYRDGSNTPPSLAAGYTDIASSGVDSNSARIGYRVLQSGDTSTGTWANATEVSWIMLRGQLAIASPIGGSAAGGAVSNQISYAGFSLVASGLPQGESWVVGFAAHRTATDVYLKDVSGMVTRSGDADPTSMGKHTDEGVVGSFSTLNYSSTVNASSGWRSYAVEVRAAAATTTTGTAIISLEAGSVPASRSVHRLYVRARKTDSSHTGPLTAELYEGATLRSSLQIPALTTSFALYELAISDAEAAAIGSYSNLEVRLTGTSLAGYPITFEVADVYLALPTSTSGEHFGASTIAEVATLTASGVVVSGGETSTGVARLSLASAFVPETRNNHTIVVRARKTNGAHTATIRAQVYEGSTPIGPELESSALTTSIATYELAISSTDADDIGSYADLEIRVRGYSSAGDAAVVEIAEIFLSIPEASSAGGEVTGAIVFGSIASVFVGGANPIYPGSGVFPHALVSYVATPSLSVTVAGSDVFGAAILGSTATIVPSGDNPPGDRTGIVELLSTATITAAPTVEHLGSALISATSEITAGIGGVSVPAALDLTSTATISVVGRVGVEVAGALLLASTATFAIRSGPAVVVDLPQVLVDYAFDDTPQTYAPLWTSLSGRVRAISSKRGRSYEFDRFETGTSGHVLDNRDSALNPENSESPYHPLLSTRPYRVRLAWAGTVYSLFRGTAEGYPQAYPSYGEDALVQGESVDPFYALNQARFVPGSTTLTEALSIVPPPPEGEEVDLEAIVRVASTELPLPQAVPFVVSVAGLTPEWPTEEIEVVEILDDTTWRVLRSAQQTWEHPIGAAVTTTVVSFAEEQSGTRIRRVLEAVGFGPEWYDVDEGQTPIAASDDLSSTSPLEHISLVAEAEFGRFFAGADGRYVFRDRHASYLGYLEPVIRLSDTPSSTGDPIEVLYSLGGDVEHSEEKLYNRVIITIPSGEIADVSDQASIDQHFERVFERSWPYARVVDAEAAALWVLGRSVDHSLRLPSLVVRPVSHPDEWWPLVLSREIGDRGEFALTPDGGGDPILKEVVIDGIEHVRGPGRHEVRFSCTETDPNDYWILGVSGYSELGETTWLAF